MDAKDIRVECFDPTPPGGMRCGNPADVRITHLPTGIVVECGTERSQHKNRDIALAQLEAILAEREGRGEVQS